MRKTEQPNVKLHPIEVFVQILKTADSIPLFPEDKTHRDCSSYRSKQSLWDELRKDCECKQTLTEDNNKSFFANVVCAPKRKLPRLRSQLL